MTPAMAFYIRTRCVGQCSRPLASVAGAHGAGVAVVIAIAMVVTTTDADVIRGGQGFRNSDR
jgi:hypothetical protein